jgi:hypothetical protein
METSHRDLCKLATEWLLKQSWCDVACYELKIGRGFADAIGVSKDKAKSHRVTIVEVKRTRSDLLQDLRANKYLKYEQRSTHCYLAATAEAYGNKTDNQILVDLKNRGVPDHWGLLRFGPRGGITCIRSAKAHRRTTATAVRSIVRKIARSLAYRALQGTL